MKDQEKIEKLLIEIMDAHARLCQEQPGTSNQHLLFIDMSNFWRRVSPLNNTRASRVPKIIEDMLCGYDFVQKYGMWIVSEVEGNMHVLVRLPLGAAPVLSVRFTQDGARVQQQQAGAICGCLREDNEDEDGE